ncbi:MAG: extracellular solute-binding protein family 1 [Paenibacillaceae bacterium]|jgi:putative aldouronate transport system substrate-binding protein|nr:extracellular solute-binding protein family 1 [Paenibacillaceae bacterium]
MRKKYGKYASGLLSLVMITTAMAACSSGSDSKSAESSQSAQESQPAQQSQPPGKRETLTVEVFDRGNLQPGQDPLTNNYLTKYIQKEFGDKNNIDIKFVPVPREKEIEQLNVLMATSDAPDIVFTYDSSVVYNYVKNGGLTDLTEALNKHGANLKGFLGEDVLKWGVYDGKQYAIPALMAAPSASGQSSLIRKDWLDKLGLPVPKTRDEFYQTLKAFKEKDPGGVGKGLVPWKMERYSYHQLLWSFAPQLTEEQLYTYDSTTNRINPMRPGVKEGLKYLNKLYNEGLMDMDWVLDKDGKQAKESFVNGRIGSMTGNVGLRLDLMPELKQMVPTAEYVAIDTFANDSGKYVKPFNNKHGLLIFVPKSSKHAAEAIKYLNWMASLDVLKFIQNGIEGTDYTVKDGLPVSIVNDETKKHFWSSGNADFSLVSNGKYLGDEDFNLRAGAAKFPGYENVYLQMAKIASTDNLPAVRFEKPVEAESKNGTALNQKWEELLLKVVVAKPADFDKTFDSMSADIMKAGFQQIMDEKLAAYKQQKK